jgi:hypothetical protein
MMMRWTGSEEQVTAALAVLMIVAALVVVGSYVVEIASKGAAGSPGVISRTASGR